MNTATVSVVDLASSLASQQKKAPHVVFERRPVEDKAATKKEGRYIARDVDYVTVYAPYSDAKETVTYKVTNWFEYLESEVKAGRYSPDWLETHRKNYARFCQGQDIPLNGVPIKGWGVIGPAQQEMLIQRHILTVEDLAGINDVGMRAIGMGAGDLKRKAITWLAQMGEKGPVTIKMTELEKQNDFLTKQVETLTRQVRDLTVLANHAAAQAPPPYQDPTPAESMGVLEPKDFLPEDGVQQANPAPIPVPTKTRKPRATRAEMEARRALAAQQPAPPPRVTEEYGEI